MTGHITIFEIAGSPLNRGGELLRLNPGWAALIVGSATGDGRKIAGHEMVAYEVQRRGLTLLSLGQKRTTDCHGPAGLTMIAARRNSLYRRIP